MANKHRGIEISPFMDHGEKTWRLKVLHNGKQGGPGHYPPVVVPPGFGGNFEITIVDGEGITFSDDPIWIREGTRKPDEHVIDPQITNIRGANTTVLTFHDANKGRPRTLTYVLNFNNAKPLDPEIQNGAAPSGSTMADRAPFWLQPPLRRSWASSPRSCG